MSAMPLKAPLEVEPAHDRPSPSVVEHDLLATLDPMGRPGRLWLAGLLSICAVALVAYVYQLSSGLHVTGMRNYVSWGTYMTNFVFFIGISHAGTLISAILRVTDAGWRRPITRMAEAITVLALLVGASMVVIDMGRPDRVLNLLLHGRFQSPILWDLVSVTTYLTGSFLYLYIAMIPDMPILAAWARARGHSPRLVRLYERLSLGYRESPEHRRRLARALGAMAVIIIPVAISVHTVVSWVFGMTLRPGWHSTIFGPYFVVGAIFSGTAAIITAMAMFRKAYHLERYLLPDHFRKLAKLLLALSLLYGYFTLSEYLTTWYGGTETDARLLDLIAGYTSFGASFWLWAVLGLLVPIALLLFPGRRSLTSIVTASVLINIGMWWKRFLIVVPTLETPFIPARAAGITPHYFPTLVECLITIGAVAAFMLLFTLFSRIFPILSIWETEEDAEEVRAAAVATSPAGRRQVIPVSLGFGLLLVGAIGMMVPFSSAHAQAPAPASVAKVELSRAVEDGQAMLVAKVSRNGTPVVGATVVFTVGRTFGAMGLGEDNTLDDGTAAVPFPTSMPSGVNGDPQFHAVVGAPADAAGAEVTTTFPGANTPRPWAANPPRALWSSRPPLPMIGTIALLLITVWSTYLFVVSQLVALHKLPRRG